MRIEEGFEEARTAAEALVLRDEGVEAEDARFCLRKSERVWVGRDDEGEVCGCGTLRRWGAERDRADAYVYVAPACRGKGAGEALLGALLGCPESEHLKFISTKVEVHHEAGLAFFQKRGFGLWYTEHMLRFEGERPQEPEIRYETYSDALFERYVDALRQSFYRLRRENDFQPYDCFIANEEKRKQLSEQGKQIYVQMEGEEIAASVLVEGSFIEDVFVTPGYQGRGLGRKLLRFPINRAAKAGGPVTLSAIAWNKPALRLYQSEGFRIIKTTHYLRRFQ